MASRVTNIKNKTIDQLKELRKMGITELHIGVESGDDFRVRQEAGEVRTGRGGGVHGVGELGHRLTLVAQLHPEAQAVTVGRAAKQGDVQLGNFGTHCGGNCH